jgi:hypothetical protein
MFRDVTFLLQLPSQYISCLQPLSFSSPEKDAEQGLSSSLNREFSRFIDAGRWGKGGYAQKRRLKGTVSRDGLGF